MKAGLTWFNMVNINKIKTNLNYHYHKTFYSSFLYNFITCPRDTDMRDIVFNVYISQRKCELSPYGCLTLSIGII